MYVSHRIRIQGTVAELEALLQQQSNPNLKERLQVLYLLKLPDAMSISAIAKVVGGTGVVCNAG
jgi:hypothetical protein